MIRGGKLTSCVTVDAAQVLVRRRLQEATEHGSHGSCQPKDHGTLTDLARSVPRAQYVVNAWVETRPKLEC